VNPLVDSEGGEGNEDKAENVEGGEMKEKRGRGQTWSTTLERRNVQQARRIGEAIRRPVGEPAPRAFREVVVVGAHAVSVGWRRVGKLIK